MSGFCSASCSGNLMMPETESQTPTCKVYTPTLEPSSLPLPVSNVDADIALRDRQDDNTVSPAVTHLPAEKTHLGMQIKFGNLLNERQKGNLIGLKDPFLSGQTHGMRNSCLLCGNDPTLPSPRGLVSACQGTCSDAGYTHLADLVPTPSFVPTFS